MAPTSVAAELDREYPRTFSRLTSFFRSRGVPAADAADLAQETASKVWLHLERHGRQAETLDPLVYRIAKNVLAEHWRTRGPLAEELPADDDPRVSTMDGIPVAESKLTVAWALKDLSEQQRRAMAMIAEGFKPADIAEELGIKRNAVDQLLHRAKRTLASRLEPRSLAGAFGIAMARARAKLREVATMFGNGPLGEAAGSQIVAIVTVSLAAAITFFAPLDQPTTDGASSEGAVRLTSTSTGDDAGDQQNEGSGDRKRAYEGPARAGQGASGDDRVDVDVRDHRIAVKKDLGDPDDGGIEIVDLDIEHERDEEGERGVTGPALDQVTDGACSIAPSACG